MRSPTGAVRAVPNSLVRPRYSFTQYFMNKEIKPLRIRVPVHLRQDDGQLLRFLRGQSIEPIADLLEERQRQGNQSAAGQCFLGHDGAAVLRVRLADDETALFKRVDGVGDRRCREHGGPAHSLSVICPPGAASSKPSTSARGSVRSNWA